MQHRVAAKTGHWLKKLGQRLASAKRGNIAIIFALSMTPLILAGGSGIDLARALAVRAKLYAAADAAALAVASKAGRLSQGQANTLAQQYFSANYQFDPSFGSPVPVTVTLGPQSVQVTVQNAMPTTLMSIAGIQQVNLSASSTVAWDKTKVWVGLALDNTGSMCQSDTDTSASGPCLNPAPNTKIYALKEATKSLLTVLQSISATPGEVQVALTPFSRDVNVGSINSNASWIDWTQWDETRGSCSVGGLNTKTLCEAAGVWTPANHNTWNGCVTDRGDASGPSSPAYDTRNAAPNGSASSKFPAHQYSSCPAAITPLGYDWSVLNANVDNMTAAGNTNQTIGLAWAWHALSQGAPLNTPSLPSGTERFIVILSDGENTQNRWTNSRSAIDARMDQVCTNAKNDGIVVWSVFVNIAGTAGNAQSMKDCASGGEDGGHYIEVTSTNGIGAAFDVIGQQITNLRVAH